MSLYDTSPFDIPGSDTCHYCRLHHDKVEAAGVWHCPNPLCTGPGAAYFRSRLRSYRETHGSRDLRGRHTVDARELVGAAVAVMDWGDEPLRDAFLRSRRLYWQARL